MSGFNEGVDTSRYPNTLELRDWAATRGYRSKSGQLPHFVIAGWNKTHPDRPFVPSQQFHGTDGGYGFHGCRCDRCKRAVHQRYLNRRALQDES